MFISRAAMQRKNKKNSTVLYRKYEENFVDIKDIM